MYRICIVIGFFIALSLVVNNCNVPTTVGTYDTEIVLPSDSGVIYRFTKRYYVLVPGDVAVFQGFRSCTTSVNGIITSCITNDSMYLQTITLRGKTIKIDDSLHFVYPQLYQYSSTYAEIDTNTIENNVDANTIIRYLVKSDSAILQVAYDDQGGRYYLKNDQQIVMPRTLIIGPYAPFVNDSTDIPINNTWPASPLIKSPIPLTNGSLSFVGFNVAIKTIALPKSSDPPYFVNGNKYSNGIFVKSFYSLHGEMIENNDIVRVVGTVIIVRTYFTERGLIDQLIVSSIQKIFSDGTVVRIRERIYVARGPKGAKVYSENEYPR